MSCELIALVGWGFALFFYAAWGWTLWTCRSCLDRRR